MADEVILITGASGQQGGTAARDLIRAGRKIRALTRHPEKLEELKRLGAEIAVADLKDRPALDRALQGVRKAFLVATPYEESVESETLQGKNFAEAASAAGVDYLVYSSVGSAARHTKIPHFESKRQIELRIQELGIPYCFLRPVFFMDNFRAPWMLNPLQGGNLVLPLRPDRPLQMIAVSDIGKFTEAAFLREPEFKNQEIELAGDDLTMPQALEALKKVSGKSIQYQYVPPEIAEAHIGHDSAAMFKWFNEVGYNADIPDLRRRWGIPLLSFPDYLKTAEWTKQL